MALTQAQLREHVGRMMIRGLAGNDIEDSIRLKTIAGWALDHRDDTSFSTASDRLEAVMTVLRELYRRDLGSTPPTKRHLRKWVDGIAGYGIGITLDPEGA